MVLLQNRVLAYPWGSRSFIAELQGRPTSDTPEAELWMGTHPVAPSDVILSSARVPLGDWLRSDPKHLIGESVMARYGNDLPFLLKILAADEPLSLQAHPSTDQAKAGFAREEAAGIDRNSGARNYKDPRHKPELLVALTPFTALSGFAPPAQRARLFECIDSEAFDPLVAHLRAPDATFALRTATHWLFEQSKERARNLVRLVTAAPIVAGFESSQTWAKILAEKYPGDVGVLVSLLLNVIELPVFSALYLPAGNMHAYLHGAGVEIMASSDNVLRGGLTPKHVDVSELLSVLEFTPFDPMPLVAIRHADGEEVYDVPASEFRLSRYSACSNVAIDVRGPEIWIVLDGSYRVSKSSEAPAEWRRGESHCLTPSRYSISGEGVVFRASVPFSRTTD